MLTRIDYSKDGNVLTSKRKFKGKSGSYYVIKIYLDTLTFIIKNVNTGKIVQKGGDDVNNRNVLARHIRKALKSYGIELGSKKHNISDKQLAQVESMVYNNSKKQNNKNST